jgi:cob(I)alamin adenosyltransferase
MNEIKDYRVISTKKGDKGTSKNYSNEEFLKSDLLFETLGTMDELSSHLGLCYHTGKYTEEIRKIQRNLQDINSLIATSNPVVRKEKLRPIGETDLSFLERLEETVLEQCDITPTFVLPGSDTSKEGAVFDLTRAIARKAERVLVRFIIEHKREDLSYVSAYVNRLSDLLFIMARSL